MKIILACLITVALCSCVMPVRRSLELGIHVGDEFRTEAPAAITNCYEWKATFPMSTRQEYVPCLAAWSDPLPEGAVRVNTGTVVTVVKLQELGLIDSASTQVFVRVSGHDGTYLVTMGDVGRLFPNRRRHGR